MRRFLNVIVSTVLAAVLMVSSVVPAMAAEQDTAVSESSVASEEFLQDVETRSDSDGANFNNKSIYPGAYIGEIRIEESHYRTVTMNVTGISGIVIFRFTNRETGDSRSFTAIGGQIHSLTYVSPLDKGVWDLKVVTSDNRADDCWVYFRAH